MLHKETHRYQFGNGELMELFFYVPGLLDKGRITLLQGFPGCIFLPLSIDKKREGAYNRYNLLERLVNKMNGYLAMFRC